MAVRINSNTASLYIRHNLDKVSESLQDTYRRLSTGERINRAGDDTTGLAISQALRNDIRSLQQNVRNVNDGVSVTSTAEAALGNISDLLNRIRELALSSGNVSLKDFDRSQNQAIVEELLDEIARIASTTEFNDKLLLDGSYADARVHVGVSSGQYISLGIASMAPADLGAIARVTGNLTVSAAPIAGGGDLTINGYAVPASAADGVSVSQSDASAIAKAAAINAIKGRTGVEAEALEAVVTGATPVAPIALDGAANSLSINGVNVGEVNVAAGDAGENLVTHINFHSNETGVVASLDGTGHLVLTAEDGRNIQVETTGGAAAALGLTDGTTGGQIRLSATRTIELAGALGAVGFEAAQATTDVDPAWALDQLDVSSFDASQRAIESVDAALEDVLNERARLGAVQNRLDDTVDSLATMIENLSQSDSAIRDADYALETANLTRDQIIQEAAVSILAQANALPRNALDILLR